MVKLSKVNLFLHGFPDPAIHIYDSLSNDARWHEKAEVLFTDYIAEHLTPEGRGGIIVPNGIVATTQNDYVKLRKFLVEDSLVAVVSLPAGVFKPYSGVKTSILFLDKKLARTAKEILFLKITADGFDLGDKRNPIEANDLPEAERVVKAWLKGMLNGQSANATGAMCSTKGAPPSQPGASPQETNPTTRQGLKARPNIRADDGSGLQPSEMILNDAPGALPQAGMGSAVGAKVVWKAVEKRELLEHRACSLQAEGFVGGEAARSDARMISFEELCVRMQYGLSVPLNRNGSGTPCFRMNEIPGGVATDSGVMKRAEISAADVAKYRLNRGDLLFNRTNSFEHVGRTGIFDLPADYVFASYLIRLEINSELAEPRYINAFMNSARFQKGIKSRASRAVNQANISASALAGYEIPLPPLEDQRRIVAEIEGYQKILDGARQILAGYWPDLPIDPDWETTPLGEIADVKLGKMLDKTKHRSGRVMPYLRNVNVRWGNIETHDLLEMYFEDDELERFGLTDGDVLVCEGGEPGRAAVWDGRFPDLKYQKALHRVRFKIPYEPKLLVYFLQALAKTKEWEGRFHGATIKHFTREMFIELPVPVPPIEEQRRIVSELDAEAAQMEAVRSLLPRFEDKIQRVLDRVWGAAVETIRDT